MTNPVSIRPARPDDVPAILGLIGELADFEKLRHQLVAKEEDFQEALFGEQPAAAALVAVTDDSQPIGYAIYFSTFSTFVGKAGIWLEDIYVRPEFRGQKIGKQLLKSVAEIAKQRNAGRLEWCVLDWNQNAIEFYESIGADVMPDWRICRMDRSRVEAFIDSD
ncbi:MAG: GNAT family N-acetyltransferase [Verrucomicrobiales bacterium]|nr:GNAT family N-acetyltransferase [Verrucomicrobiales bacterium]